ncbi:hypothetical protein SAMN06265171_101288 [Chryseobacterium rhizoplanae]|uniref:Uncharacterized protein n=1 Tax=Chryseobacterium rhizoplanae TaxID=1609531 RepID=A0A521AMU4_9FLAO|nr:hypothetical protein SAMN06265171_101288 [Chryseobacterium rhizoplanae]
MIITIQLINNSYRNTNDGINKTMMKLNVVMSNLR